MRNPDEERFWALCELAANESDPAKVVAIAKGMNLHNPSAKPKAS